MQTKTLSLLLVGLLLVIATVIYFFNTRTIPNAPTEPVATTTTPTTPPPVVNTSTTTPTATTTERGPTTTIGSSVGGETITAYHFGSGPEEVLFIGGIHGGYSWNTALLGHELIDYLGSNPNVIPENVTVTVIPTFNADGLVKTVGTTGLFNRKAVPTTETARIAGRFNNNTVDLNRNFDCEWQSSGKWQSRTVSGGTSAFSEPETKALRDYVAAHRPAAVVAWYSAAGGVYASTCGDGIAADTKELMNTYAKAASYPAHDSFDYYEITGDMVNWFAKEGVPAVSVLLTSHDSTEWEKNRAGVLAVLASFAE